MKSLCTSFAMLTLTFLTGCASTSIKTETPAPIQDVTKQYAPWVMYSISEKNTIYLALPSSKKEVEPRVYKIWTKNTDPKWNNITIHNVVDCNSRESMTIKLVGIINGKEVPLAFETAKFERPPAGTVGEGLVNFICK